MSSWTPELRKQVVDRYVASEPTAENSSEIIKEIAEELEQSANGVRQVLIQEKVYVKKEAAGTSTKPASKTSSTKAGEEGGKRVSKDSQIAALRAAIEAKGAEVDDDVISKLTGKAAAYFTGVITA